MMKKILLIVLVVSLMFVFAACGSNITNNEISNDIVGSETSSEDNAEWKLFLNEYEEWVDKYIEISKKYKDNPADLSILSDYTDMLTELTEWTTKTENMEKELEGASTAELAEYSAELARIVAKIAQVAN